MKIIATKHRHHRISMQPENIRATLAGRKTATRRICHLPGIETADLHDAAVYAALLKKCPFGQVGGLLYFAEAFADIHVDGTESLTTVYRADTPDDTDTTWTSPRFMPKAKARFWVVMTSLRLARVQHLTSEEAIAEGIEKRQGAGHFGYKNYDTGGLPLLDAQASYASMFRSIHGPDVWTSNPVVWVIGYRLFTKPTLHS